MKSQSPGYPRKVKPGLLDQIFSIIEFKITLHLAIVRVAPLQSSTSFTRFDKSKMF